MKFKPLYNNVVIKPIDSEEQQHGNIVVPDMGKEKASQATVVAIGPGWTTLNGVRIMSDLKIGDTVFYSAMGGQRINYQGEEYFVFKDTDLLTIIEEEKLKI